MKVILTAHTGRGPFQMRLCVLEGQVLGLLPRYLFPLDNCPFIPFTKIKSYEFSVYCAMTMTNTKTSNPKEKSTHLLFFCTEDMLWKCGISSPVFLLKHPYLQTPACLKIQL